MTYLAKVSEYEKNPWAAGWFINLVTRTMVVSTDAINDIDPIMIYTCASSIATTVNNNKNSGRMKTPTPITMCNVTIPIFPNQCELKYSKQGLIIPSYLSDYL